jgi:hypothetical protein
MWYSTVYVVFFPPNYNYDTSIRDHRAMPSFLLFVHYDTVLHYYVAS